MHLTYRPYARGWVELRVIALALTLLSATAQAGSLVIVGGGLSADNADVLRAFIDRVPAGEPIVIIPSASAEPQASAADFTARLVRYGVASDRIAMAKIAAVDDPATVNVDESQWASNGRNMGEIAKVSTAGGIWFTGGDQARTMRVLVGTPMLKTIRARLRGGAVIGGTSAGAAIMGQGMIWCGDPARSLSDQHVSRNPRDCAPEGGQSEPLVVGSGLGFLPRVIVDQHFAQRHRLPRLQRAIKAMRRFSGIGIDEDTALIVDLDRRSAVLAGRGGAVTVQRSGALGFHKTGEDVSDALFGKRANLSRSALHSPVQ